MTRPDIQITRMRCASFINSPRNFMSYDYNAGEKGQLIKCITTFWTTGGFIKDLLNAKIVSINLIAGSIKDGYESLILVLKPEFGYTNQKFEDILCELFDKHNL